MAGRLRSLIDWANEALAKLPTVPFRVVQLSLLDFATFAWAVTMSFTKDSQDAVPIYSAWLYFLAAMHGVSLGAYVTAKVRGGGPNTLLPSETGEYQTPPVPPAPPPAATVATITTVTTPATTPAPGGAVSP
jgi:hypothetical protein